MPGITLGAAALVALGVGAAYASNFTVTEVHSADEKSKAETGRVIAGVSLGAGVLLAGASAFFFWRQSQAPAATTSQHGDAPTWQAMPPPQLGFAPVVFAVPGQ